MSPVPHQPTTCEQPPSEHWSLLLSLSAPGVSHADARQPGKSPGFSVNWIMGSSELEVINATTGKRSCGSPSRLCKHMFFTRWAKLHGKVGLVHWEPCQKLSCSPWRLGEDEDKKKVVLLSDKTSFPLGNEWKQRRQGDGQE